MRFSFRSLIVGVGLPLAFLGPANAQATPTPRIWASAGYSYLHDFGADQDLTYGLFVAGTYHFTHALAVVGEVGNNSKRFSYPVESTTTTVTTRLGVFMGGGQYECWCGGLRVNGHFLGGAARESGAVPIFRLSVAEAETKPAIQTGVGVTLPLHDRLGAAIMIDYRRIFSDSYATNNEVRFAAGLAVGFGKQ